MVWDNFRIIKMETRHQNSPKIIEVHGISNFLTPVVEATITSFPEDKYELDDSVPAGSLSDMMEIHSQSIEYLMHATLQDYC